MTEDKITGEEEVSKGEALAGCLIMFVVIPACLWCMKKMSESANNQKIGWGDWVTGHYGNKN